MDNKQKNKNSAAKIKANNKWIQTNYKRMQISTTPEQADYIRETAKKYDITIVQLILNSIKLFEENAERLPAGAATPSGTADPMQPEQPEQQENVTTESPMESEETAGAQPEEETEEETENKIETEENQTAGAEEEEGTEEEPQEDEEEEEEDEKPEDIPAFVWEQLQRLKKADKRQTAERKAREAAERKRRRIEEGTEDY